MRRGFGLGIDRDRRLTFSPLSVAGCILWLQADRGVTVVGGLVSAWADQSGRGANASVDSAGEGPVVQAAALAGRNTLRFDGTKRMRIDGPTLGVTGAFTCFVVAQCTGPGTGGTGRDSGLFGNGIGRQFQMTHDLGVNRYDYVAGASVTYALAQNVWAVQSMRWNGTTAANKLQDWKNGALGAQGAAAATPSDTSDYRICYEQVSSGTFFHGDVAAIAIYGRAVSDAEESFIARGFGDFFKLAVS